MTAALHVLQPVSTLYLLILEWTPNVGHWCSTFVDADPFVAADTFVGAGTCVGADAYVGADTFDGADTC